MHGAMAGQDGVGELKVTNKEILWQPMAPKMYRFTLLIADPWPRRQMIPKIWRIQTAFMHSFSSNSNIVFPTHECVMKESFYLHPFMLSFTSPYSLQTTKLNLLQWKNLNFVMAFKCLRFWWKFLPEEVVYLKCSTCTAFKFLGSTQCQPVLQARTNGNTGSLKVVLKVVTADEGNGEH